ncbi:MAG: DNA repair protein RecN [Ilumatobacteraceae bacterium]
MLTELHIEDLGVIDRLDLVLGDGLTALTGETGAGKTMLVEAISLLVGGRADAGIVRPGSTEARVEGRFVINDEEFVLARVIPGDGRSRAYLNGRLATVATLSDIGAQLVDLHGQHAHQSLLGTATQRAALDHYGIIDLSPLREARARLTEIDAGLAALGGDSRSRAREIDLLRFQVDEINAADLVGDDEEQTLDELEDVLAGAVAHREASIEALGLLNTDGGALDQLGSAIAALGSRTPFLPIADRLHAAVAELGDAASELRDLGESIEEDPERLAQVRERRQMLRDLRRKYGETLAEVIAFHTEISERLDELESYDARAESLDRERQVAVTNAAKAAAKIGAARRAAAPKLAKAVKSHLRELAMPHADLGVDVGEDPGDDVTFLLAANPGSPLLPLTRVASGGELARSMLALRLVLSQDPSTLVFDEVDAGIGGSAAIAIGRALAVLGDQHQVLVVTHLPQVAAFASTQIVVSKHVAGGVTRATAVAVRGDDRVDEIARMLSGDSASTTAREHAMELLGQRDHR